MKTTKIDIEYETMCGLGWLTLRVPTENIEELDEEMQCIYKNTHCVKLSWHQSSRIPDRPKNVSVELAEVDGPHNGMYSLYFDL